MYRTPVRLVVGMALMLMAILYNAHRSPSREEPIVRTVRATATPITLMTAASIIGLTLGRHRRARSLPSVECGYFMKKYWSSLCWLAIVQQLFFIFWFIPMENSLVGPYAAQIAISFAVIWLLLLVLVFVRMLCSHAASEGKCIDCGYNLTGNVSGRCPECGSAVQGGGNDKCPVEHHITPTP